MVNVVRLAILLFLVAGCGLKGPLTLPEPDPALNKEQKK
jgi:predicted small lipoprotein YifL